MQANDLREAFVAWIRKKKKNKIGIRSSADGGVTWGQDTTLDARSRKHGSAAVAFGNGRLYVAWATKEGQNLRIKTFSVSAPGTITEIEDHNLQVRCKKNTGPALAYGLGVLALAWVKKNR